jgi:arabinofuranosyltransferase
LPPFEWISVGLGIASSVAALGIASLASERLLRGIEPDSPPVPFGSLVVLAIVPFWDYATSGLETSLVFLWLALAFWAVVRQPDQLGRRGQLATGVLIGLGPLVRPDLGIFSLIFGGLTIACAVGRRRRLEILAAALALPVAYEIFRMGYFASLVPNTALAKEASFAYWKHGWIYLQEFETTYQLPIALVVIVAAEVYLGARLWKAGSQRSALLVALTALGGIVYGLYITRVGGDFLHARLLLPALFALLLPVATLPLRQFKTAGMVLVPWAMVCVLTSEIPLDRDELGIERGRLNFIFLSKNDHPVTIADYKDMGWGIESDKLFASIEKAKRAKPQVDHPTFYSSSGSGRVVPAQFNDWVQAEAVAYRGAIGLFSYKGRQRVHTCDYFGLADAFGARLELGVADKSGVWHVNRGKPGHEKRLKSEWCLARTVKSLEGRAPSPGEKIVLQALGCGDLAHLEAAVTEPLTFGRFFKNLWLAPRLTRMRIPQDNAAVLERFCG